MIYKLHYWFFASGANVFSILIGVFIETYTDASPSELGTLLMVIPFLGIIFRPIICSVADRKQAHRKYLITCLLVSGISYAPFVIIPFLGESVYRQHARTCWYIFMVLKVIGDVAFGGVASIGDSLAINYAKRIGTNFTVYRVWGTISWMFFGIVIGQVNEVQCLPKYVPGFMILIVASLLNCFFIWLWPKEYFEMSSTLKAAPVEADGTNSPAAAAAAAADDEKDRTKAATKQTDKKENAFTKSLMPKEVVWAQAKQKLKRVFCCGLATNSSGPAANGDIVVDKVELAKRSRVREIEKLKEESREINKMTQVKILFVLLRRDPRILFYLLLFVVSGVTVSTMSFFYISLSAICHSPQEPCDFSQLAGFLQVSMAWLETLVFVWIARAMAKIGRVNMAALAILCAALKYTFYGTIWSQVSPYYSLIAESSHGIMFGIYLTLMVETGHLFSSEVQYIIPELLERGIISVETDTTKLKYSLAATMQAIISSSFDGFGKGLGAMTFGVLLEAISFEELWLLIGIGCFVVFAIILGLNLIGTLLNLRLGLDVKAKLLDEAAKKETEADRPTTDLEVEI